MTTLEVLALEQRIPVPGSRVTTIANLPATLLYGSADDEEEQRTSVWINPQTEVKVESFDLPLGIYPGYVLFTRGEREYTAGVQDFLTAIGPDWEQRQKDLDAVRNPNQQRFPFLKAAQ